MVYQWKSGARIAANPQVAGDMCKRLEREGRLTAKDLLDENRPEDAPLHNEFEWNDGVAAENWREQQARHIINSLVICPEKSEPVRGFFKIERAESKYQSVEAILQSEDSTQKLLSTACAELFAIKKKYATIQALSAVWAAIDSIQQVTGDNAE